MNQASNARAYHCLCIASAALIALASSSCKKGGGGGEEDSDTSMDTVADTAADTVEEGDAVEDVEEEEVVDPCWLYPCGGACGACGWELGNIIENVTFTPGNAASSDLAGTDGVLSLGDLYQGNVAHGGAYTGVLLWLTTGWCPYCGGEAPKLQGLYDELRDEGILIVAVVSENDAGAAADAAFANAYATRSGWTTLPAVAGDLDVMAYPPDDRASPGVPLHLFLDLSNMRIYGRYAGATEMKLPRYALEHIASGPEWGPSGERLIDFDCSPGTGTEVEPNGIGTGNTPHDGTTLPATLTGVECPPQIGDDILLDGEAIDLGTLASGDVIEVTMSTTGTDAYPWFELLTSTTGGYSVVTWGPAFLDTLTSVSRQWVIDAAGHYYIMAMDGRYQSGNWYADGATIPVEHQCCEGGPTYDYELGVSEFTLAATESDLTIGTSVTGTMDGGDLNVYPVAVTAGSYTITMTADDTSFLDPYLQIVDPTTGNVLASNDDISTSGGDYNSRILWSATSDTTIWIVAAYWGAWYRLGAPGYTLLIE